MSAAKARVLAVDDDRDLLRLLSIRLRSAGFDVATVDGGEAALAAVALQAPDVIVTDKRMAGMDGLALFDRIEIDFPNKRVVFDLPGDAARDTGRRFAAIAGTRRL